MRSAHCAKAQKTDADRFLFVLFHFAKPSFPNSLQALARAHYTNIYLFILL